MPLVAGRQPDEKKPLTPKPSVFQKVSRLVTQKPLCEYLTWTLASGEPSIYSPNTGEKYNFLPKDDDQFDFGGSTSLILGGTHSFVLIYLYR